MDKDKEKINKLKVDVDVAIPEIERVIEENADLKHKLRLSAEKLLADKKERFGVPDEIDTIEGVRAYIEENNLEPLEYQKPQSKPSDVINTGGAGNLPLSHNMGHQKQRIYDNTEQMMLDIMRRANEGDVEAQQIKAKLQEKFYNALKSGKMQTGTIYSEMDLPKDKLNSEKSILFKILELDNEKVRNRALKRRDNQ